MKIVPSLRYQLREHRHAILIYYGIITAMILLSLLFIPFAGPDSFFSISSGGITAITGVFAGICSLCAFKDSFRMNLQHGVSRQSQFLARVGSMGILCAVMAVGDEIFTLILELLDCVFPGQFFGASLYEMMYESEYMPTAFLSRVYIQTTPVTILLSVVFSFFFLLAISSFAYLISVINFRLNKLGKTIFWVGWPFLFIVGGAFLDTHPYFINTLASIFLTLVDICISTLPRLCLTCFVLTVVFTGLTWLPMRRAHVK